MKEKYDELLKLFKELSEGSEKKIKDLKKEL